MEYPIRSNYVKGLVRGKSFRDEKFREYIDDILFLEHSLIDGLIGGMAGNLKLFGMKNRYEKEYLVLCKELNPKKYKQELKRQRKEREERRDSPAVKRAILNEHRKVMRKLKQEWIKAGGAP